MARSTKLLTSAAALMLVAGTAKAADVAPIVPAPPPIVVVPPGPGFDFAGPYVGIFGGAFFYPPFQFGNFRAGIEAGYNLTIGNSLLAGVGVQLTTTFGVYEAIATGRLGVVLGERALVYARANLIKPLGIPEFAFAAGGGVEIALGDRVSVFGEALAFFASGAYRGTELHAGVNFHFGN